MDRRRVIGLPGGGLPWHLPDDVAHFRSWAEGRHLLLGRKTFEEMRGWFTTQTPLVLTRRQAYQVEGGHRVGSVAEAREQTRVAGQKELLVVGGAEVFLLALPLAKKLVLTLVAADVAASLGEDAARNLPRFPDYEQAGPWRELSREPRPADAEHPHARIFVELERV